MPNKKNYYKFAKRHPEKETADLQREIEDNMVSFDKDGNIILDKDIHCRSIYVEGDSLYIGGVKFVAPSPGDTNLFITYNVGTQSFEYSEIAYTDLEGALPSVSAKTADYTSEFNDFLLCDGTFTVTLPDIASADIGKKVTICNNGTGIITADGDGDDTLYDEADLECIPDGTFALMAATTSTWVLV